MRRGPVQLYLEDIEGRLDAVENAIAALEGFANGAPDDVEQEVEELQEA